LTSMSAGANQAAFSPDGKSIAFHSGSSIYLMNADGTDVRPVIVGQGYEHPTFGPDGSTLIADRNGNDIDSFDLTGHNERAVVGDFTIDVLYPTFSRDGVTMAFIVGGCVAQSALPPSFFPEHVGLMAFGSYLPDACNACPGSGYNLGQLAHPSWGPRSLLTFSHTSGNGLSRIVVLDTANLSAEPVEILQDEGNQRDPSWAPSSLQL
jgi:Tol biopolymer transport system component